MHILSPKSQIFDNQDSTHELEGPLVLGPLARLATIYLRVTYIPTSELPNYLRTTYLRISELPAYLPPTLLPLTDFEWSTYIPPTYTFEIRTYLSTIS